MLEFFTRNVRRNTVLTEDERQASTLIVGAPGVGKTRLIESVIRQDISEGRGVGMVDVAGDLYYRLLAWLATQPAMWKKVILIDPTNSRWIIRLNPLATLPGIPPQRIALLFTDMVIRLWKIDPTQAPRMVWVMTNAFLALSALGLTLDDLSDFLLYKQYRDQHLSRLPRDLIAVQSYFEFEYPKTLGGARLWSIPILNKLDSLLFDPDIRVMMTSGEPLNFRDIIDQGHIVLAYLPKGILGREPARLAAAFIVARFQQAAMSRANTTPDNPQARPPYYLYLDEFQNYTTDNITDILDESRKYHLRLVMAHQYLDQLTPEVCSSVLSTSGSIACMRVGYDDGKELAPYIFPHQDFRTRSETQYRVQGMKQLRTISVDERRQGVGWDGLAEILANQEQRRFWLRRKGDQAPMDLRTIDTPDIDFTPELEGKIAQLRDVSGQRFGVRRDVAEATMWARDEARLAMRSTAKKAQKKTDPPARPKRGRGRPKKGKPAVIENAEQTTPA